MEPDEREVLFHASERQHREHLESLVYSDYKRELQDWLTDAFTRLAIEDDHNEVMRYQGRIQALQEVLAMPERVIAIFEAQYDARERSNGN